MRRKFERNELEYAANWMLKKILPEVSNVHMNVYVRKMKRRYGICMNYNNSRRRFTIVIDSSMGRKASLRVLAHEVVHVMQYATGMMTDLWGNDKGKVLWKERIMTVPNEGDDAYYNSPWEKQAYNMMGKLADAYVRHVRKLRNTPVDI